MRSRHQISNIKYGVWWRMLLPSAKIRYHENSSCELSIWVKHLIDLLTLLPVFKWVYSSFVTGRIEVSIKLCPPTPDCSWMFSNHLSCCSFCGTKRSSWWLEWQSYLTWENVIKCHSSGKLFDGIYRLNSIWQWQIDFMCGHHLTAQIEKFMGPIWGPPGSCRPKMGPMLAPWTLLSGWPK